VQDESFTEPPQEEKGKEEGELFEIFFEVHSRKDGARDGLSDGKLLWRKSDLEMTFPTKKPRSLAT